MTYCKASLKSSVNQTFTLLSILSIRIHCWFLKCKPLDFSTSSKVKTEMTKDNANTVQFQILSWKLNITFTFSTAYLFTTIWHKSTLSTQGLTFSGSLDLVNLFIFSIQENNNRPSCFDFDCIKTFEAEYRYSRPTQQRQLQESNERKLIQIRTEFEALSN